MTTEEFNKVVSDWGKTIKARAAANLVSHTNTNSKDGKKLLTSITSSVGKSYGTADRVGFGFEKQGIYIHYGVGRGYVRDGNSVKRYAKPSKKEKLRVADDWLDVELRKGIKDLSSVAQEYYGDEAMQKLLEGLERMTIEKKQ